MKRLYEMHGEGHSARAIARELGLACPAVPLSARSPTRVLVDRHQLDQFRVFAAKALASLRGQSRDAVSGAVDGVTADAFQVGLVFFQGIQSLVQVAGYVYAVGGVRGAENRYEPDALPGLQPLVQQFLEHPPVAGVSGGVEH